ncbi:MAG: DUF2877 domain-containing protein [Candidatus Baldrarchaeia archaeon]
MAEASAIGQTANEILSSQGFVGTIHSVFENAFNIITPVGKVVGVITKNKRNPISVTVLSPQVDFLTQVKEGMEVIKREDYLIIPKARLVISLKNAELWVLPKQISGSFCSKNDLKSNLEKVISVYLVKGKHFGLGQLIPHVLDGFQHVNVKNLNMFARIAFPRILALNKSIMQEDLDKVVKASTSLIGLGPGLTPSADDMLTGLMSSMWLSTDYFKIELERVKNINACILSSAEGRTNLLSQKQLEHASKGEVSEEIFKLIRAILLSEEDLVAKTETVLEIGYTSGADTLLGVCLGLQLSMHLAEARTHRNCQ